MDSDSHKDFPSENDGTSKLLSTSSEVGFFVSILAAIEAQKEGASSLRWRRIAFATAIVSVGCSVLSLLGLHRLFDSKESKSYNK
jgi:hypothetical protein